MSVLETVWSFFLSNWVWFGILVWLYTSMMSYHGAVIGFVKNIQSSADNEKELNRLLFTRTAAMFILVLLATSIISFFTWLF